MIINGRDTTKYSSNSTSKKDLSYYKSLPTQKASTTQEKMDNLWVESTAPNTLQKQNINTTVKPVNISDFVNQVKNTPKQNLNVEVKPIDIKDYAAPKSELKRIGEEIKAEKERWDNLPIQEKIADPFKTIGANYTHGDLSIKESMAWNEYRTKQDEASLKKAQDATKAREDYEANNDRIGKGNALTKDFAQYLPQLGGQLKSGLGGAAVGAGSGALGGAGIALAAGQLGPQVAVPEEIATVPAGAVTGAIWGGRGGYVAGTAKYGYDTMAGAAYKNLLDLGVPNDIALEISNDEAVINSLIEGGGAIIDLISLGIGKLASKGGTTAAKQVAKNKLIAAAKAYGLNVASEGLEEGLQEIVSIGSEKRATEKAGIEREATLEDDINRVKEATKGGLTIAAIGGLGEAGMNYTANTIRNNRAENQKVQAQINQDLQNLRKQNVNSTIQRENVTGLPKMNVQNQAQIQNIEQPNVTLPTQAEMAQNANMEQITQVPNLPTQKAQETLQSAKIAGMTDMDMQKAIDLNNMLRSGANLEFYDAENIPENVQADKAKVANGFYKDGTLWINKNSKNKVEQILGHELTHHLETTNSYNDLSNTILDSEIFYDFVAEKGYTNVAEYKTKLKEMGYTDAQMNNEMVARFVEEKMFTDQASIDRLARQNTNLVEKIKNWISDLVVSFKGTAQEKELRRIENMYRKALEQARNSTATAETQYSYSGTVGLENLKSRYNELSPMQKEFLNELENNYQKAVYLSSKGYKNDQILKETGWFESDGKWKWEIPDEYFKLKNNANLSNGEHDLSEIIDHDLIFMVYPDLAKQKVIVSNKTGRSFYNTIDDKIYLKIGEKNRSAIELSLLHEVQHSIQNIEGFDGGTSSWGGMLRYYKKHGEIEASDTVRRFKQSKQDANFDRENVAPELSKENPKHPMLDKYLAGETKKQTPIRDYLYQKSKEKGNGIYEKVDRKAFGMEIDETNNGKDMRVDNGGRRVAGKEPAFSMPETDNQGRTLSKEQQEFFKDSKVRDENGKLQVVYHGTGENFTVFSDKFMGKNNGNALGQGYYFSSSRFIANSYKGTSNGKLMEVYLNIQKPFDFFGEGDLLDKAEYLKNKYGISQIEGKLKFNLHALGLIKSIASENNITTSEILQDLGYDGIISGNEYIAFEPNQIKNVDNTNPTSNPDIRYSMNQTKSGKKTTSTKALSTYAQTLQSKHQDIPEQVNLIQKEVDNGNFMHEVVHDKRSLNYAQKYIEENGFEDAVNHWDELIKRGKPVDKDELALGQTIYNIAVDNKDTRLVMKMASDLVQEYTEIGRNLQSATLLRKMTPDGKLYALERSVQKINQDLMQKFDDFENIKIPEELADKLLRSETKTDMDKAVEQIQEYIASKIPATWQEKLNSWRYLAMLGNLRTHIRNIVGNAVFIPAVEVKNALAQVGELAISKDQRTKAIVTSLNKNDAKLLKYAENDFDNNRETIRGENKYDIKAGVQEKRTIYSWKAIEAARRGNFNLLEAEDTLFLKYRYKKAFAGALKARGITIEQLRENSPETVKKVSEIRNYAINEAQKATYRDASKVAAMVSRGKRKLLNAANQSTGAARLGYNLAYLGAEGVMPFAKTPINIVKRGIEYSPAGLLNGIKDAALNVKNGKKTAAQAIDEIAAGATGTAIAAFGLFLASLGLVSGGEEEKDKEQALKELKGNQNYSFNAFGKSYTIDWTAPSSIPLFIGVELYNSINSEDESAYLNALSNLVEPVVEMSMLQGINDTLKTMGEENAIGNIISKTLMNYLGQYNPTILGQIARSFDPVRRTTYVDKNIPIPAAAQRFIQQQAAKIPGVSRMLPTYKDQFGQEQLTDGVINRIVQNFFSPGYLKDIKEGTVEQGLTELYEKTGETSVIPSYASKTLTHNSEKINLTAKQYDTYAKTRGELSKKGLEGLFKDNYYKNLSDEQKVKVVEAIYDYAGKIAKTKVIDDYELEFNDKKIQKLQSEGLDFYKYILLKKTADADGNDYTSNDELDKAIKKYGLTRWQKTIKEKNTKTTKTTNTLPTLASQRAKLPTLKK